MNKSNGSTVSQLLIPFASSAYRHLAVALVQVGMCLALPATFTYCIRQHIGYNTWRKLHYATCSVYVLVTSHGLLAGTNTQIIMSGVYGITSAIVAGLTSYRSWCASRVRSTNPRPLPKVASTEGHFHYL